MLARADIPVRQVEPIVLWPSELPHAEPRRYPLPPTDSPPRFDGRPDWLVQQPPCADEYRLGWIAQAEGRDRSAAPYCPAREADRFAAWLRGFDDRAAEVDGADDERRARIASNREDIGRQEALIAVLEDRVKTLDAEACARQRRATRLNDAAMRMAQRARASRSAAGQVEANAKQCGAKIMSLESDIKFLAAEMGTLPDDVTQIDLELGL